MICEILIFLICFAAVTIGGICGIGGGVVNLAVLYYFFSMDTKKAAFNSILIILLSQLTGLSMTLISGIVPEFDWRILAAMVSAGVLGGFFPSGFIKSFLLKRQTNFLSA